MNRQFLLEWAQILMPVTILIAGGALYYQIRDSGSQQQISKQQLQMQHDVATIGQLTELNSECWAQRAAALTAQSPLEDRADIALWYRLCPARILVTDIVFIDVLRDASSRVTSSFVNDQSAQELSVALENGLVHALLAASKRFLMTTSGAECPRSKDERHRAQDILRDVYMFAHPNKTFETEKREHEHERTEKLSKGEDTEHDDAFLDFVQAVHDVGSMKLCGQQ